MKIKLHAVTDANDRRISFFMTAGQVRDYTGVAALLDSLPKAQWMLADPGYDADWLRDALQEEDHALHPRPKNTQQDRQIRRVPLQRPQPHGDHVWPPGRLASRRDAL
jgi:transposase